MNDLGFTEMNLLITDCVINLLEWCRVGVRNRSVVMVSGVYVFEE